MATETAASLTQRRYVLIDNAAWTKPGEVPRNVLSEVLPSLSFTNKADGLIYNLEFAAKLTKDDTLVDIAKLLRDNMKEHYDAAGWGWNEKKKLRELKDDDARFLIVRDASDNSIVAFVHFRFLVEGVCTVLYCYELQIRQDRKRRNLGRRLMTILEMIGRRYTMEWVMLTVLLHNTEAVGFYKKLGYIVDETSPQMDWETDEGKDVPYEILSKRLSTKQ